MEKCYSATPCKIYKKPYLFPYDFDPKKQEKIQMHKNNSLYSKAKERYYNTLGDNISKCPSERSYAYKTIDSKFHFVLEILPDFITK